MHVSFSYQTGISGPTPKIESAEIYCDSTDLYISLAESLRIYGLRLPQPTLALACNNHEISISTTASVSNQVPSFFYGRKYPSLDGFEDFQNKLDKRFGKDSALDPLNRSGFDVQCQK